MVLKFAKQTLEQIKKEYKQGNLSDRRLAFKILDQQNEVVFDCEIGK